MKSFLACPDYKNILLVFPLHKLQLDAFVPDLIH